MLAWALIIVAGLVETAWAASLKYTEGFTRLWPSVLNVALMGASVFLLSRALKSVPIGTGYAVWTGIGAVGATLLGMALFHETQHVGARLGWLALIVIGIAGLRITGGAAH
jgi:quaternary ammonium compound-resistance protein SugE